MATKNPSLNSIEIIPEIKNKISPLFGKQQQQDENELLLYGNVDIREAQLAFNSSEHIIEISVEEGQQVKKGSYWHA